MSLQYIRDNYNVPAKRGARIEYTDTMGVFIKGFTYWPSKGTIVGARGKYLRVRFDGHTSIVTIHPTNKVKYLQE